MIADSSYSTAYRYVPYLSRPDVSSLSGCLPVSKSGHLKLVGFGRAKRAERIEETEAPPNYIGAPDYMAPEVIRGHEYHQYALDVALMYLVDRPQPPFTILVHSLGRALHGN